MNKVSVQSLNECFNVSGEDFILWDDEWNEKIAYSGAPPWNKGMSGEYTNEEHSEFMKIFPRSPESNMKRSETMKGKNTGPRDEETKRKISEALRGKKYKKRSEEHCKKISERMKGNDYGKYKKKKTEVELKLGSSKVF
jgi:hypothetical protein